MKDFVEEQVNWTTFVINATVSNLLWLNHKPFKFLSLCSEDTNPMIKADFTLMAQVYEQAADSWLGSHVISKLHGYCDHSASLFISTHKRLEVVWSDEGYVIKLLGAWQHDMFLCLWISHSDLQLIHHAPAQVDKKVYWKFVQLNIMLASLFNPAYIELLKNNYNHVILEMILPNWEIAANQSVKTLKSKLAKLFKAVPPFYYDQCLLS